MTSDSARSFLFVPGNRPDRFDKAARSGAHRVIVDLEDAVGPAEKRQARDHVADWAGLGGSIIRINGAETPWFEADTRMVRERDATAIMLPKAEPDAVEALVRRLDRGCAVIALIETVEGYLNLKNIVQIEGVTQLAFGNLDFGVDSGISEQDRELDPVRLALVLESRRANLARPIEGVTPDWSDAEAFSRAVGRARTLGFGGKLCIHPAQVALVNDGFRPTADELAWARRVIDAIAVGGAGAITVDGKMVDRPVAARARSILAGGALAVTP